MSEHAPARLNASAQTRPTWWDLRSYACMPATAQRVLSLEPVPENAPAHARALARANALEQDRAKTGFSHADFVAEVTRWQPLLRGLAPTHVAIFEPHPAQFAALLWACLHAGKVAVLPSDTQAATLEALDALGCARLGALPNALARPQAAASAVALTPLDLQQAQLGLFTSGSQGQPQLIEKKLSQLDAELGTLERAFTARLQATGDTDSGTAPALQVWSTVSHQHIYGLLFLVLWSMASGRHMGSSRLLYPEDMVEKLTQPAILITTPAHLRRLDESLDWQQAKHNVRAIFSSGGPLPLEAAQLAHRLIGTAPIEIFGSSETGGIAWRQAHTHVAPWQVFEGVDWQAQNGLLQVRSGHLADGEWFTTSDRIEALNDQHFQLLGRQDRIVKIEEKRISLTAIERQLLQSAAVQEVKTTVISTGIGERVAAVVVLTPLGQQQLRQSRQALIKDLRALALQQVEPIGLPKRWRFVDALPINAQGKTPHALLEALFAAPPATPPSPAPAAQLTDLAAWPELPAIEWIETEATQAMARLRIDAGLRIFQGHFPQQPILPGVAQLDWAISLGHAVFELPALFMGLQALKFVRPIEPGTTLFMQLNTSHKAPLHTLSFQLYSLDVDGQRIDHASGRSLWQKETHDTH